MKNRKSKFGFLYIKNMTNFETFRLGISSSINLLFTRSSQWVNTIHTAFWASLSWGEAYIFPSQNELRTSRTSSNTTNFLHFFSVGWASDNARGFGEQLGVKAQILNIIHSTRTVMRSEF